MKPHKRNGACYSRLKIGLLGGSFNPAHEGHLAMSLYALKALGLDQVWWLVSPQNPLKSNTDMATFATRMHEAQSVAQHPRLIVTALESELGTKFTAETLRILRRRFPRAHFVWLMGGDNLRQIPQWHRWQEIFHMVPVAVFRRPTYGIGRGFGKAALRFDKTWHNPAKAALLTNKGAIKGLPAWIILDNKLNYTSATQLRKERSSWPLQAKAQAKLLKKRS